MLTNTWGNRIAGLIDSTVKRTGALKQDFSGNASEKTDWIENVKAVEQKREETKRSRSKIVLFVWKGKTE